MAGLILPKGGFEDVENQADAFSSLKPTASQAAGTFFDSIRETMSGPFLRQKELNSAGFTPFNQERDYVDPKQLNEKYGLEGLDFSKVGPRTDAQAKLMYNNKLREIERNDARERAQGWSTAAAVSQDLVAGVLDPIGLGIGIAIAPARFVPGLRALVPVAEDVGARFIPRASAAFVTTAFNGAAGMSLVEPYNVYMHQQMQDDYTMADSLKTIAFGGIGGGSIHAIGLGLYKAGKYAINGLHRVANSVPTWMNKVDSTTHELALDARIKQIMVGDDTGVDAIIHSDKNLQAEAQVSKILEASKDPSIDVATLRAQIEKAETSLGVKLPPEVAKLILGRKSNVYSEGVDLKIPVIERSHLGVNESGPLGSNDGGVFTLADGTKVYAKFPANAEQAKVEVAAHLLYAKSHQLVGETSLPTIRVIKDRGQIIGVATKWIDGLRPISPKELSAKLATAVGTEANKIRELGGSWIFDAWIGNRDVYGTGPTWNIFTDDNGNYFKMDFGGSLDARAQGGPKQDFGNTVLELDSFKQYIGKDLLEATKDDEAIGIEMVLRMTKEDIRSALMSAGFEGKRFDDMVKTLLARQEHIRERFPEVARIVDRLYNNKTHAGTVKIAEQWLEDRAKLFSESNPLPAEIKVLQDYLKGDLWDINVRLWEGSTLPDSRFMLMSVLEDLIEKQTPLEQQTRVYRWLDFKQLSATIEVTKENIRELLEKTAYPHKGFLSVSPHPDNGMHNRDVLFVIDAEPGVKGVPMKPVYKGDLAADYADEIEFLIARNQLLVIDKVEPVTTYIKGVATEHVQVTAKLINPETLHKDAGELARSVRQIHEGGTNIKTEDTFAHPADQHIARLMDEIAYVKDEVYAPVLTDVVDQKTKLMLETEREISELEASVGRMEDLPDEALKLELAAADEGLKKTEGYVAAMKQAWACYKGI